MTTMPLPPAPILVLALVIALTIACESKEEAEKEGGAGTASEATEASTANTPPDEEGETQPATAPGLGAALERLAAKGWAVAPAVPFDDDGRLPEALLAGTLEGQTAVETWVLQEGEDGAYVQVLAAGFDSVENARAASGKISASIPASLEETQLYLVLTFEDDPELAERALAAAR